MKISGGDRRMMETMFQYMFSFFIENVRLAVYNVHIYETERMIVVDYISVQETAA